MKMHRFFVLALTPIASLCLLAGCEHETPTTPPQEQIPNFVASVGDSLFMEVVWNPSSWDSAASWLFQLIVKQQDDHLELAIWDGEKASFFQFGRLITSEDAPSGWIISVGSIPQHAYWGPVEDGEAKGVAVRHGSAIPELNRPQSGSFRIFRKS